MISIVWAFVRANLPASIAVVASSVLLGAFLFEKHEASAARADHALCIAQSEALMLSNTALQASLRQQNLAVNAMKQAAEQKRQRATQAVIAARAQSVNYHQRVQRIQSAQTVADECAELKQLLQQFARP